MMKKLIDRIFGKDFTESNAIIQSISGIVDYFSSDEEKDGFISFYNHSYEFVCEDRSTYGDWQTPQKLAREVCLNHRSAFGEPDVIIEPTCGKGAFVKAALDVFPDLSELYAIEIRNEYTKQLKYSILCDALADKKLKRPRIYIINDDFFSIDLNKISEKIISNDWKIGIIGNPPWVTNSHQGKFNSDNTPLKSNIYGLKGIDAITGKSNFDISEYITLSLLDTFGSCNGGISFLLKNSVIRNIIFKQSKFPKSIYNINQLEIDASKEFEVSVEASCLTAELGGVGALECNVLNFYDKKNISSYGWTNGCFVSDLESYQRFSVYDGHSSYEWRSGIKHDCAAALELKLIEGKFVNGFGEDVDVESDLIYPLLKSSDINKICGSPRKFIIVPQHKTGENTSSLKLKYPKLYEYLESKAEIFEKRKSSIYKGKDRFSIFGVGDYTFKPFKVVVSSLYKDISFALVKDFQGKPYVVDDTCYQLAFDSLDEARAVCDALMSFEIQSLLKSLVFKDAKRVVTKSLLMRLDLDKYCTSRNMSVYKNKESQNSPVIQLSFFD